PKERVSLPSELLEQVGPRSQVSKCSAPLAHLSQEPRPELRQASSRGSARHSRLTLRGVVVSVRTARLSSGKSRHPAARAPARSESSRIASLSRRRLPYRPVPAGQGRRSRRLRGTLRANASRSESVRAG